jgi:hypothetical protein
LNWGLQMKSFEQEVGEYYKSKAVDTESLLTEMVKEVLESENVTEELDKLTPQDYQSILGINKDIDGDSKFVTFKGRNQLKRMSALSKKHYAAELSDLFRFFPSSINNRIREPKDAKGQYKMEPNTPEEAFWFSYYRSKKRNTGEKLEDGLLGYFNFIDAGSALARAGTGIDMMVGDVKVEVKSSEKADPNYQLNSSSVTPDPNKAYIFILESNSGNPNFIVVSSDLLYKVIMFNFVQEIGDEGDLKEAVRAAVVRALKGMDLTDLIAQTIVSGDPEFEIPKTLQIGDSPLRARIRIMFSLGKL